MGYDRDDSFPFDFETNGIPLDSKSKGKLSSRSYPIQFERKWKYSFFSVRESPRRFKISLSDFFCSSKFYLDVLCLQALNKYNFMRIIVAFLKIHRIQFWTLTEIVLKFLYRNMKILLTVSFLHVWTYARHTVYWYSFLWVIILNSIKENEFETISTKNTATR